MFALTHINRDGMRGLTRRNTGSSHFATQPEADQYLVDFNENNHESTLIQVFGKQSLGTFEIRPVECYMHGDAVGVWFD